MKSVTVFIFILIIGCSTNSYKKDFDIQLNSRTPDEGEKIGIKDKKIIISKRIFLEEELFKLQREIEDLENSMFGRSKQNPGGLWLALKSCRERLSDPRIGGNGIPEPMEKWEKITQRTPDYIYIVENNFVIGLSEEELSTRINRMKADRKILADMYDDFNEKLLLCEAKYKTTLIQHGMNPEDTKSQGEWVDGSEGYKVWRLKKASTYDVEELMRRKREVSNE